MSRSKESTWSSSRRKKVVRAGGDGYKIGICLDLESQLREAWLREWFLRRLSDDGIEQITPGVLVRLALEALVNEIGRMEDEGLELVMVRRLQEAARGSMSEETAAGIAERMSAAFSRSGKLTPWHELRSGKPADYWDAMEARAESRLPKKFRTPTKEI